MNSQPEVGIEMLQRTLDALDFPVYTFDKERRVLYANEAMRAALPATTLGDGVGAAENDHFENNQYYDVDGNLLDYPQNSAVERALRGEATHDLVLEHRKIKEHTHQWISVSCVPVMDTDGNFEYGILWYRDISRRQSREHKLHFLLKATRVLTITTDFRKRLKEKAALAVPTLADWCAIEIVDQEGGLERVALVHRDPKKIEWIKEYEQKYHSPSVESASARVVRTGKPEFTPRVTSEMIENAPGLSEEQKKEIYDLKLNSIMVLPIGNPERVLGALTLAYAESGRDYTEDDFAFFEEFSRHLGVLLENARLYNEINQRDLYKDMFLASLSHELRNPLAPIKTSLELLKLHNPEESTAAEVKVIEHQFDHMARLLNDLLDATRFVRGKIRIERETIDLGEVVEHVVKAHLPVAEERNVVLAVEPAPDPLIVDADRTRMEQAITNVVNNAVKFTSEGGKVTVAYHRNPDGCAVVTVQDTGAGITADELKHIFEPYYQSDRVKGGNSGLGIGLRLVHEIMRLHGGSVTVESAGSGLGSEFTMKLPLVEEVKEDEEVTLPEEPAASPKDILIIDDNQAAADALVRLFTALGWKATAHYSAREAFAHIDDREVDIIFADIGMPEMNGYEFVKTLRENGYTDVPVVALTGYGLEEDRERALKAGFNEHLTKPVGVEDLKKVIIALT